MKLLDIYKYLAELPKDKYPVRGVLIRLSMMKDGDFTPVMGWSYHDLLTDDWTFIPEAELIKLMRTSFDRDLETFTSFVYEYGIDNYEDLAKLNSEIDVPREDDYDLKDAFLKYVYDSTKESYDSPWDDLMQYERENIWRHLGWKNVEDLDAPRRLTPEEAKIDVDLLHTKVVYKSLAFKEIAFGAMIPEILASLKEKSVFVDIEEYSPYKIVFVGGTGQTREK